MIQNGKRLTHLVPVLKLLCVPLNPNFKSSGCLSHHCLRKWVKYSQIKPALRNKLSYRLCVLIVHSIHCAVHVIQIVTGVGACRRLGLSMIRSSDLRYKHDGLQARLVIYNGLSEAFHDSLRVAHEPLEAYRGASLSSLLRWNSNLTPVFQYFFKWVALSVNETVLVHHTRTVELVSLPSDALEPESRSIVEMLCSAQRSGTVSSVYPALWLTQLILQRDHLVSS